MVKTTDLPLVNVSEYWRGNQKSKEHEDPDGIEFPMTSGLIQRSTDIALDELLENKLNHSSHYNDSLQGNRRNEN